MRMNKYLFVGILLITLSGCQQEHELDSFSPNKGDVAFYMPAQKATKSSDLTSTIKGVTIPLSNENGGVGAFLEESITYLDAVSSVVPQTKGTPVYTNNFQAISKGKFTSTVRKAGSPESDLYANVEFAYDGSQYYRKDFPNGLWDNAPLYFYMWMPGTKPGVGEDLSFDAGKISFTFDETSMTTADSQIDLLFTSRYFTDREGTPNDFNSYNMQTGAPLLFQHVLSGVKFSTANYISGELEGTKTYIKEVKFKGLADGGFCEIDKPVGKEDNPTSPYVLDNTSDYSSARVVKWKNWTYGGESTRDPENPTVFSQTFSPENHKENVYAGSTLLNPTNEPSFFATDAAWPDGTKKTSDWNINTKDGEYTFWFIPQTLTDDVELEITFYIQAGEEIAGGKKSEDITYTIPFGKLTKYADWKAGELRTYVLKATEVAVTVEDSMSDDGQTKTMIQIRNMGNVPEWVRATVVGYWADAEGNAVYGYTSNATTTVEGVESYTSDDFVTPWDLETEKGSSPVYGTFTGWDNANWIKGSDGYYYYKNIIGVDQAATTNLFTSYAVTTTPSIYPLDRNTLKRSASPIDVHLEMKIVVQAILAEATQYKDAEGHYRYTANETYSEGWADATIVSTTSVTP